MSGLAALVTSFADGVPEVAHAAVVSAEGLPVAVSPGLPPDQADQLAAVTAGLTSLMQGAARIFEGGPVAQTVVQMERGVLIVMSLSQGAVLAVLAAATCDLGLVCYEMAVLAEHSGPALAPARRGIPDPAAATRS
jgi:predicted regulator of Ras-like GTPase activity (Roadblock/LC7/MglB family)